MAQTNPFLFIPESGSHLIVTRTWDRRVEHGILALNTSMKEENIGSGGLTSAIFRVTPRTIAAFLGIPLVEWEAYPHPPRTRMWAAAPRQGQLHGHPHRAPHSDRSALTSKFCCCSPEI